MKISSFFTYLDMNAQQSFNHFKAAQNLAMGSEDIEELDFLRNVFGNILTTAVGCFSLCKISLKKRESVIF